ncbi:hypothetical protein [Actinokineospora pegani]|uniref:hypothetical protein n=1 Tax=Actinokineospora pegani TaxID=2654637 RepID=UPI0012E9DFAB|nr:hypothetical protein [Actinokineospora pegani]
MSLWRIGFKIWSTLKIARVVVFGAVAALVALLLTGPGPVFWVVVGSTVLVGAGAWSVLAELEQRETGGKPTPDKARK